MNQATHAIPLEGITLGPPKTAGPLTLFPLLSAIAGEPPGYLTLEEALARESVVVTEQGEGTVPEILVENAGNIPLLLFEGEELIGARQNRCLNLTIIVAAHTKIKAPVSCVEHGRWSYRAGGRRFRAAEHHLFAAARREKVRSVSDNLRASGRAASDQGQVWEMIADKTRRMAAASETDAVDAVYEKHSLDLEGLLGSLAPEPAQVGVLVGIGGEVAGLDIVDHPETWQKVSRKILRSYGIDALESTEETPLSEEAARSFWEASPSTA